MERKYQAELLSPAGSFGALEAALAAGADAVYAGGQMFGARALAENLSPEELIRGIEVCHIHGRKFYLTLNTLVKDQEMKSSLYDFLLPLYEAGLDAVIVQDLGVLDFVRREFPGLPIHASTQMCVTGQGGMKFLEKLGVSRVIPARELTLCEIKAMHEASFLEIETFIHGALCYCYSGRCLMSSFLGGRSGNRGRCAGPCRLSYQAVNEKGKTKGGGDFCPLSMKDLSSLSLLPQILEAGVVSLKIEGRMKQSEYTAGVTAIYRKYLDLLLEEGPENYRVDPRDEQELLQIYSRGGSCGGYYENQNGKEMISFVNEPKTGECQAVPGKAKEEAEGTFVLFPGKPASLELRCRGVSVRAEGEPGERAEKEPLSESRVREQLAKMGGTEFVLKSLTVRMGEDVFYRLKSLNDLRREAVGLLEKELTERDRRTAPAPVGIPEAETGKPPDPPGIFVSVEREDQGEAVKDVPGIQGLYLPWDLCEKYMAADLPQRKELYLMLPQIVRSRVPEDFSRKVEEWISRGMKGFLIRDLEGYALVRSLGYGSRCVLDSSLYTWNRRSQEFWREQGILRDSVPLELKHKELEKRENSGSELLLYGYVPLMVSAQCVQKNVWSCNRGESRTGLVDRYRKTFPCQCVCHPWKEKTTNGPRDCYNIVYNTVPLSLLREREQVEKLGVGSYRISFTLESPGRVREILEEFLRVYSPGFSGLSPSRELFREQGFTRGHFSRGVQ